MKYERKDRGHYMGGRGGRWRESPKQDLTSAKDLTMEFPKGRKSHHNKLD